MSIALPIPRGPLRGAKWFPSAGGKLFRVLMGTYEREQTALFRAFVRPGDIVFDVGAHVGYYTLLAVRLVGPAGQVIAFEPEPRNAHFLEEHLRANRCTRATVYQCAVGDHQGNVRFKYGTGTGTGRVSVDGSLTVPMVSLDGFLEQRPVGCHVVKIDVEGGELAVLRGGERLFRTQRPVIFLSTHGPEVHRDCIAFLRATGYVLEPIVGTDVASSTELFCRPATTR